ncbi:glutathione-regulated potassium-efflux system protein KefC [Klebsiella pneumoniae subsp. pneumoniae]|nr:glutathione-regulated potassium-efflux system protein KefC [Klebsiella pneumoniae subsp. pneumoniae]
MLIGLFCMLLGLRWQVAELIGMTLALSSTAIAMQAMNERNLTVSQMGRSAFAVLLFQDIAAIPLVAMIPLLAASGGATSLMAFALSALKVAAALALVVVLGRYLTRPLLRFVARSGLREVFSAVALFLVFGFGLLLEEVGLSMAMGRFSPGCCWPVPNIVMRWRVILSRLKDCCWGCSLSASACRLISAPWSPIRCVL